jgi:Holliday junction resolvase-like predicted endonuclease
VDGKAKYETGVRGENFVDEFMFSKGWKTLKKRAFFKNLSQHKKGEIDRVYVCKNRVLCAEIKTISTRKIALLEDKYLVKLPEQLLKPRQIQNLCLVSQLFPHAQVNIRTCKALGKHTQNLLRN